MIHVQLLEIAGSTKGLDVTSIFDPISANDDCPYLRRYAGVASTEACP